MKKKWSAKSEIRKLDAFCRKLVMARDHEQCRRCGKGKLQVALHWAHVISRSKKSVRWDLKNSFCLCYYCHFRWAHEQPLAFAAWVREQIGDDAADTLTLRGNTPQPLTPTVAHIWWSYLSDRAVKLGVEMP